MNALSISLTSAGRLRLDLRGHSIEVPATIAGLQVILTILRAQSYGAKDKIGSAAAPTQAQVQLLLAQWHPRAPYIDLLDIDL